MYKLFLFNKSSSNMDVNAPKVDESKEKNQWPTATLLCACCCVFCVSFGRRKSSTLGSGRWRAKCTQPRLCCTPRARHSCSDKSRPFGVSCKTYGELRTDRRYHTGHSKIISVPAGRVENSKKKRDKRKKSPESTMLTRLRHVDLTLEIS